MKRFFYIMTGVFMLTLAIVVGLRMSADAMAVIIGIVFGLVATIPTTVLLIVVLKQKDRQQDILRQQTQSAHYPPVVVVNSSPNGATTGNGTLGPQSLLPPAGERSFKVVGQEPIQTETLSDAFNLGSIWDD